MFLRNWARLYSNGTEAEKAAEKFVVLLGKPYRAQHPFFGICRIVDFALLDDKVIIEVDGSSHELPVQRRKDITSTLALIEKGWRTVRFTNTEALRFSFVEFKDALEWRLRHLPTPAELREALLDLDREFPALAAKTRKRRRVPAPKKARKRGRPADSRSKDTTE